MTYSFHTQPKATPQTEAIPGRETEMIQGKSGAVTFDAGIWSMLRRCLIMGTAGGSYYAGKRELTSEFVDTVNKAIAVDPHRVAQEIVYASEGRSLNNSAPIFALTILSSSENPEAKKAFKDIFLIVVRTGSHFHEWVSYTKSTRGMGRLVRDAGLSWLQRDNVKWLAYQMLKYGQRHGFTFADELRLFKPKPVTPNHDRLYEWTLGKEPFSFSTEDLETDLNQLNWYEWLKKNPEQGEKAVRDGGLTHEMVAPICKMNPAVWQALFEAMPITALLRNLGSLTEIGVIRLNAIANLERIEKKLTNKELLKKALIHPIDVLKALKTYQSGGTLGRSSKTWIPVSRVIDTLEKALELSFETQEPTNKIFLHAIDISASMSWGTIESINLMCSEIAATMALVTAKTEKNYIIRGFSTEFKELGITASDSFRSACEKTASQTFGATDASAAYDWAIKHKQYADVFCFWTDSESWAGRRHPGPALKEYRQKINPDAKAVYVTLQPNRLTLADPKDSKSFDLGGFDPSIPGLIQMIANGEV